MLITVKTLGLITVLCVNYGENSRTDNCALCSSGRELTTVETLGLITVLCVPREGD